jgi:hypothetical protein
VDVAVGVDVGVAVGGVGVCVGEGVGVGVGVASSFPFALPAKVTVADELRFVASLVILIFPLKLPAEIGANSTVTVVAPPGGRSIVPVAGMIVKAALPACSPSVTERGIVPVSLMANCLAEDVSVCSFRVLNVRLSGLTWSRLKGFRAAGQAC